MEDRENELSNGIISLIRSAIHNKSAILPESFDWNEAMKIVESHGIASIVYFGVSKSYIKLPDSVVNRIKKELYKTIILDEIQADEVFRIFKEFSDKHIDYMPLKGIILKCQYPNTAMRVMGDADILIRMEQYSDIAKIMSYLGYTEILESDHEMKWFKPPFMIVELHKRLIALKDKTNSDYYGNGWRLARRSSKNDSRFEMIAEDELIYMLIHFAKHYRNGGIGIKHLVDFQVFNDKHTILDQIYIRNELEKLELYSFYQNILETLQVWFNDVVPSKMSNHITERIFLSGAFGRDDSRLLALAVKGMKSGETAAKHNRKTLLQNILLPLSLMKNKYSILETLPILLPFFWIWRVLTLLFLHRDKLKRIHNEYKHITDENVKQYQKDLIYVGLGDHLKDYL